MSGEQSPRWYALHVRTNCENLVAIRLREIGISEYLPYHKPARRTSSMKTLGEQPLFPGYVFCKMDLDTGPRLYRVPGVVRILGTRKYPTPIEDAEIESVRRIAESHLKIESYPYLHPGDPIWVVAGPLAGISGTVLRSDRGRKLVISFLLLQRSLAVTIPSEWVESAFANRCYTPFRSIERLASEQR
jgi:transcription antitermination factor NusG